MPDPQSERNAIRPLSYGDVQRAVGLVFLLFIAVSLVTELKLVLILFAIVAILAMVLNPVVAALQRRGLKRGLAVALIFIVGLAGIAGVFAFLVPPFLDQVQQLSQQAPELWRRASGGVDAFLKRYPIVQEALPAEPTGLVQAAGAQVGGFASFVLRSTLNVFANLILIALGALVLIFLLANPVPLVSGFLELVAPRHREATRRSLLRMMAQMSAWARGVLINGVITAITTGALLAWAGVQPAYVFGVFAFFGEFVPIIGPVIVAVPALLVAASISFKTFLLACAAILFVQQVETNLLIPFVMGRQMDLHPVIIMFFTLAMGSLLGAVGALLVMPAAALFKTLIGEFYLRPRAEDKHAFEIEAQEIVSGHQRLDA